MTVTMRNSSLYGFIFVFILVCGTEFLSSALVVRISEAGSDNTSCREPNATLPCKHLLFALGALNDTRYINETEFTFLVEGEIYPLRERIKIDQTNASKHVYLTSSNSTGRTIIRCENTSAGIDIGSSSSKTRNINFQNLVFQNCGSHLFAAVVLIRNSVDVNFTNCTFQNNNQAGINAFDSQVAIESCHFSNNTSNGNNSGEKYNEGVTTAGGGAGFLFQDAKNLSLIIRNSIFESNAAVTNNADNFVAPSFSVSQLISGGGGLLVVFRKKAQLCWALIENSRFINNTATFGGGLYLEQSSTATRNKYIVVNSHFIENTAGQTAGGISFTQWNTASSITTNFKNCIISKNRSKRGAGMNVFSMTFHETHEYSDSVLSFDTVTFSNNHGRASSAIRFTTALPYGSSVDMTPEFINCSFTGHDMSNFARTSPFTSQRVNLKFMGQNIFQLNYGGGAATFQDCVVHVNGTLTFANNTGSNGGALFMRSSQIKLYPDSKLVFKGNKARGLGGAIFVREHQLDEFIHAYNPDCFLTYVEPRSPPSKWKTNVSFIENSSNLKGAAIYISSLRRCVWNEDPLYNPNKALRWNNKFMYKNNFLIWDGGTKTLTGSKYDIATDTKYYNSTVNHTVKLAPGEDFLLDLQAVDELRNEVITTVFVSEVVDQKVNSTASKVLLDEILHVLSPNETVLFSFHVPKTLYHKIVDNKTLEKKRKIQFVDPFSTLINGFWFEMKVQPCYPGFKFSGDTKECVCDTSQDGVERCENGSKVFLKKGYWANTTNDTGGRQLVTYFCPFKYCKCTNLSGLPGCLFDPNNSNDQCAKNREGWMCGKCTANTSVGLRWSECIKCEESGWVWAVVIPVVVGLCVLVIWLNPGISSELRGPLFFYQVLPFIFDPTSRLGLYVYLAADVFNFGGPFMFIFKTCIFHGLDNLYAIAFGYALPLLVLLVFLLAYLLSANYFLRFNLRRRSMTRSFWLLLIFVYNYLVETSFLILFCPKVGDKYVFFYDGSNKCFHGKHLPIGILAIFVLVIFVITPPIVVLLLTNGYFRSNPQYVNALTNSLRPERRWWWSVDLCRRVVLTATFAFVANWQTKKILMIFVSMVILAVHSNCQPYMRPRANYVESVYLMVLSTLAIMQIVEDKDARFYVCLVLLLLVFVHTLVVFLFKAVHFFRKRFDCCADAQTTVVERTGYEELEHTQTDQSLDREVERRRNLLDTIFRTSADVSNHVSDDGIEDD